MFPLKKTASLILLIRLISAFSRLGLSLAGPYGQRSRLSRFGGDQTSESAFCTIGGHYRGAITSTG